MNIWAQVESQIAAGTYPAVCINHAGELCLDGAVLPKRLAARFPDSIKAEAESRRIEREKADKAKSVELANLFRKAEEAKAALIAPFRDRRVWGVTGEFLEEETGPRYTLSEIEQWHNWSGIGQFRANAGSLSAVCYGDQASVATIYLDRFFDCAGVNDRHRSFNFHGLIRDLEARVAESRTRTASGN